MRTSKAAPISTDKQKVAFLARFKKEICACPQDRLEALYWRLAKQMKEAGLYSRKTVIVDIANGVCRRILATGWRKV